MRYIPPKKVRVIFLIALLPALLLTVIGGNIQSKPVMFTGIGIALLALIFYWIWYRCPHCGRHLGRSWGEFCPWCGTRVNQ